MLVGDAGTTEPETGHGTQDKEELLERFSRECREIKQEQARIAGGHSRGTAGSDEVARLKKRMRSMEDMYLRRIKELEAKNE